MSYKSEYGERLVNKSSEGMTISQLNSLREFILGLDQAITQKQTELIQQKETVSLARDEWLQSHQKTDALTRTSENLQRVAQIEATRREGTMVDDILGARSVRDRE